MRGTMERMWVSVADSRPWRKMTSNGAARRVLRGRAFRTVDLRRRRLMAGFAAARHPGMFSDLETVCLFIGHVKSGGTLVGAMVDSHPDALVADEIDVLDHLDAGFDRARILHILAKGSRREAMKGRVTARRLEPYSLAIPGGWQGRHRRLLVVGESRAGPTTRRLGASPDRIQELVDLARPARLRFVHVVRNPLDPIGAMVRRGGRTVEDAIDDYGRQAERVDRLRSVLPADHVHTVYYEEMISAARPTVESVVTYLGLDLVADHVEACAELVDPDRPGERRYVDWTEERLQAVRRIVETHQFLSRYKEAIRATPVAPGARG